MRIKLYRCLKPESIHFFELGNLFDMESEEYHYLRFADKKEEILSRNEVCAINYIDTKSNKAYEEVTEEQEEFVKEIENDLI